MDGSMTYSLVLLTALFVCNEANIPRIHRGRPKGGMLGSPGYDSAFEASAVTSKYPPAQWYVQKLDHFNAADTRYWNQRYFTNSTFYKPGGPLFVNIGGEGSLSGSWLVRGAWISYAITYSAYLVQLEHRFYGESHPTEDLSVENLQFLSSEQALADLAVFITDLKQNFTFPKVIIFGGSYSGALAAWFRLKYPHIADGAVASSAPVMPVINFKQYNEVVDSSLRYFYPKGDCNAAITTATNSIRAHLTTAEGRQYLKNIFRLCDDIDPTVQNDIISLYASLAENVKGTVQYNKDNIVSSLSNITINTICDIMTNSFLDDPLMGYAQINDITLNATDDKCLDFKYDKYINETKEVLWNSTTAEGDRQWTYQSCTEYGFFQSSDSKNQPFGQEFPIDYWVQQCADIFGPQFKSSLLEAAVKRTVVDYGGLGIRITRVVFPNGSIDPWHVLGVLQDLGSDAKAILITGTAHCADMYTQTSDDLPELIQARKDISNTIGVWLQS